MSTYDQRIAASNDDAFEHSTGRIYRFDASIYIGSAGAISLHAGWRWTGVGIGGSTINSAALEFKSNYAKNSAFITYLYAEKVAAPAAFVEATYYAITGIPRTTQYAAFGSIELTAWTASSVEYYPPAGSQAQTDFIALLQEVATAFPSLNAIKLLSITQSGGWRRCVAYDLTPAQSVRLTIDYTATSAQTVYPAALSVRPKFGFQGISTAVTVSPPALAGDVAFPMALGIPTATPAALTTVPAFPTASVHRTQAATALAVTPAFPAPTAQLETQILYPSALSPDPRFPAPSTGSEETVNPAALHVIPSFPGATVIDHPLVQAAALRVLPRFPLYDVTLLTLSTESYIQGSGWAPTVSRAYFSTRTDPYQLIRLNPADLTYTVYTAPSGSKNSDGLVVTGGKVYVNYRKTGDEVSTWIDVFDVDDATPAPTSYDLGDYYNCDSIATDGTYLYLGTVDVNSPYDDPYILKITISSMTVADAVQIPYLVGGWGGIPHAIGVDDNYVIVGRSRLIDRLDKSDLGNYANVSVPRSCGDDIAVPPGDYAYVAQESGTGQTASIVKLTKSNLSYTLHQLGETGEQSASIFLDWDGLTAWVGGWLKTPGSVARFTIPGMTVVHREPLPTGCSSPDELTQYAADSYLVATYQSPSRIVRLTLRAMVTGGAPPITATPLSTTPAFPAPAISTVVTVTATALSTAPAFPAKTYTLTVTASALAPAPRFPAPAVGTTETAYPAAFRVLPAFPAATVVPTQILTPSALDATPAFPAVTVTATVTITATAFSAIPGFPAVGISTTVTVTATAFSVAPRFGFWYVTPGTVTVTATAFSRSAYFPEPEVIAPGVGLRWEFVGSVSWPIDPAEFPATVQFRVVAWIATSSALLPVSARLYDVTHGVGIAASEVQGTLLPPVPGALIAPTIGPFFTIPTAATYAIQFGGQAGGSFVTYGGALDWST